MHDATLTRVSEALSPVHMETTVEAIFGKARARRRRRASGLAVAGVTAGVAVTLAATGVLSPSSTPLPTGANAPRLAAFSISDGAGGQSTLTLRKGAQYRLDPAALRAALAQHGIPAVVTVGESCDTDPEPPGLDAVVASNRQTDGSVVTTFNPSAIPAGAKVSIGYYPQRTTVALIEGGAPLRCAVAPARAASGPSPVGKG